MEPIQRYRSDIQAGLIEVDSAQEAVVQALQVLYEQLCAEIDRRHSLLYRCLSTVGLASAKPIKGLYVWGDVGRGKTFLMELFYEALPFQAKLRLHFHRFMRRVHKELAELQGHSDPLAIVAKRFAEEADVICFDEFFVSDITDAMLLARLLKYLFDEGIVLVATSNIPPAELYKDGLQRQQFLPAIQLIKQNLIEHYIASETDYRTRALTLVEIYHTPADNAAYYQLEETFVRVAASPGEPHQPIEVEGRLIATQRLYDDVVWFDFNAICDGPRSQADYIEIARCFHTVLISKVPVFTTMNEDKARRFIALIDEFYDRHVKLILTAEVVLEELYQGTLLKFEFQRTMSRLTEMRSKEYLSLAHRP